MDSLWGNLFLLCMNEQLIYVKIFTTNCQFSCLCAGRYPNSEQDHFQLQLFPVHPTLPDFLYALSSFLWVSPLKKKIRSADATETGMHTKDMRRRATSGNVLLPFAIKYTSASTESSSLLHAKFLIKFLILRPTQVQPHLMWELHWPDFHGHPAFSACLVFFHNT